MFIGLKKYKNCGKIKFLKQKKPTYYLSCCVCDFLLAVIFEGIDVYYRSIDSNVCVFIHCIYQNLTSNID